MTGLVLMGVQRFPCELATVALLVTLTVLALRRWCHMTRRRVLVWLAYAAALGALFAAASSYAEAWVS